MLLGQHAHVSHLVRVGVRARARARARARVRVRVRFRFRVRVRVRVRVSTPSAARRSATPGWVWRRCAATAREGMIGVAPPWQM